MIKKLKLRFLLIEIEPLRLSVLVHCLRVRTPNLPTLNFAVIPIPKKTNPKPINSKIIPASILLRFITVKLSYKEYALKCVTQG